MRPAHAATGALLGGQACWRSRARCRRDERLGADRARRQRAVGYDHGHRAGAGQAAAGGAREKRAWSLARIPRRPDDAREHQLRALLGSRGAPEYARLPDGDRPYFEDLAHDSGASRTQTPCSPSTAMSGRICALQLAFRRRAHRHQPISAQRLLGAPICLTDEQLRAEMTGTWKRHKLPMDCSTSTSCSPRRRRKLLRSVRATSCSAGTKHPGLLHLPRLHPRGSAVIIYANNPYLDGHGLRHRRRTPEQQPIRRHARRRARPRAQRVDHRPRAQCLVQREGRRGRPTSAAPSRRRANLANRSARRPTAPTTTR